MQLRRAVALIIGMAACAAAQDVPPIVVPLGVTDLLAVGRPAIYYVFDGKAPMALGIGWTGYDPDSGVYFQPEQLPDGGTQVFVHSPWIGGVGVTAADYALQLPMSQRIRLSFETGLRPQARGTDGVTYRIKVAEQTLFDEHCTWKEFRPAEVDLSPYAGQTILLRLEVDPGPNRKSTDDWSLWRNVRLLAGTDQELQEAAALAVEQAARQRAADLRRGQELADISLLPLTSQASESICPDTLSPATTSLYGDGERFVFRCEAAEEVIEYRLDAREGLLAGLEVSVNGRRLEPAAFVGGPRILLDGREFATPTPLVQCDLLAANQEGDSVRCDWKYSNPQTGSSVMLTALMRPQGKSLRIEVRGQAGAFTGFTARPSGGRSVPAAFSVSTPPVWRSEGVYVSSAVDLMRSSASVVAADSTQYATLTNGTRNAMHDVFYLTVTSRYEEAFANLTHAPSPYLDELAHRVVLDAWAGSVVLDAWRGSFAENEQWLRDMAAYGIDSLLMIKHVWQRDGYDHSYPNTMPANAEMGGDEGLRSLCLTARTLGHRFCVHENYYDFYPNAESFREADCALDSRGQTIPGWDNGQVRAVVLKPSRLMDYVQEFSPEIARRYECNAAYHDIMPTWYVDYDAGAPGAGSIRYTHEQTRALCEYDRSLFGGPVVFEAADPALAGVYDGGCNYGVDTYRIPTAVAFELLKVHPRMSNHGFGYYERWLPWGYSDTAWFTYVMTDRELDKYRAYQVAFGRTGFIGQQLMKHPHAVVREYYLMQAFARAYTGKLAQRIRYQIDGVWVDAGTAARLGDLRRLNVEYEDGQQVYVNLADEPWEIAGHVLPPAGHLTVGPRAQASVAVRDGQICDLAQYEGVIYADARSHHWQPPPPPEPITPSVGAFRHLGGKEFELTVNWRAGRQLDRDYTVFWHFVADGIAFQTDHLPPVPTTLWQVGQTVSDGPLRLSVKDDPDVTLYDVCVGLYDHQGRAPLVGGAGSMRIARLRVKRQGAEAVEVSLEPVAITAPPGTDPAPYREGANLDRKVIDFGPIATNGAAILRPTAEGRELIPVPLGASFVVGLLGDLPAIHALDAVGAELPAPALERHDGKTWFEVHPDAVRYLLP